MTARCPLSSRYVPVCVRCGPQRGPEAVSGAVHGHDEPLYPGVPLEKKLQDRSDTASGVPLHQKHMASSRLLTYPQGTARNRELLGKLRKPTSDTEQLQIDTMRDTGDSYTSYKHANKNSL